MHRVLWVAVVVSLGLLVGGLTVATAGGVAPHRPQAVSAAHPGLTLRAAPAGLRRALKRIVEGVNGRFVRPRVLRAVRPPGQALPGPMSCAVGDNGCSLTPCVEFATSVPAVAVLASPQAVGLSVPQVAVPSVPQVPPVRARSCRRSGGPNQVQRVTLTR